MRNSIPLLALLCALMTIPTTTWAQKDAAIGTSISDIKVGEYWYGKKLDKRDLIGKVVLMEIWGS